MGLIATYKELAEVGQQVADDMQLDIEIQEGLLDNAIEVARAKHKSCEYSPVT